MGDDARGRYCSRRVQAPPIDAPFSCAGGSYILDLPSSPRTWLDDDDDGRLLRWAPHEGSTPSLRRLPALALGALGLWCVELRRADATQLNQRRASRRAQKARARRLHHIRRCIVVQDPLVSWVRFGGTRAT
jgi:hypothetical protein